MKFQINRDYFANGLARIQSIAVSRAGPAALSHVLIEADSSGFLTLTGNNLDFALRCRIKAVVDEAGSITLPAKRLSTIIRELSNIDVNIESGGAGLPDTTVRINSGSSKFKILGLAASEFPVPAALADARSVVLAQSELATMIDSVRYAQSTDETRYVLAGTNFTFGDRKLTIVATDGRRLSTISQKTESPLKASFIVPAKGISELVSNLGAGEKVKIEFTERAVHFRLGAEGLAERGFVGEIVIFSKLVDGNYPNWKSVIPKEDGYQRVKLDRVGFRHCLTRAALVLSEKSNSVRMNLTGGQIVVSASSPDLGDAREVFPLEHNGDDVDIAFNPSYLMAPLDALLSDEVFLEMKDGQSPAVMKTNEAFTCVVMPLRLP